MNRALRIIFSRYGIVVIILILVLGVIALANERQQTPLDGVNGTSSAEDDASTTPELTENDGLATDDCEGEECYPEEELPQAAVDQAMAFAAAFLNPNDLGQQAWYDSITPYLTDRTADAMVGVEPDFIPAETIAGEATASGMDVAVPLDTGTMTLTMTEGASGGWLVSAIDWEPA